MSFKIKLWGVRGSLPTPQTPEKIRTKIHQNIEDFLKADLNHVDQIDSFLDAQPNHKVGGYGGHTTCVEAFTDTSSLIIDGGSGIRKKAIELMAGPCGSGQGEVHILLTHFHWDHLMGFPFFVPMFIPGNKINIYSVQSETEQVFNDLFKKPYFPVPYSELAADIVFHQLEPRVQTTIDGLSVTPYELDHPDPCWGFRIEHNGLSYAHCVDTEATRVTRDDLGADLPLYEGADLMVFDAQYTIKEATEKIQWGHSSASFGMDLAVREQVKRIIFVHHDPAASDDKIKETEEEVARYCEVIFEQLEKNSKDIRLPQWSFAVEDQVIEVGSGV